MKNKDLIYQMIVKQTAKNRNLRLHFLDVDPSFLRVAKYQIGGKSGNVEYNYDIEIAPSSGKRITYNLTKTSIRRSGEQKIENALKISQSQLISAISALY